MGTSTRGILLSGIYCMLGFYNLSFNATETESKKAVTAVVASMKAEKITRVALKAALADLNSSNKKKTKSIVTKDANGSYSITPNLFWSNFATITSTMTVDEQEVTIYANVFKPSGKNWEIIGTQTKSAFKKTKK